jgi:hypothetical protein
MGTLNLLVQFIIAIPKLWSMIGALMDELNKMKERQVEEKQNKAVGDLTNSKPGTEERKDALRKWVDSDRG